MLWHFRLRDHGKSVIAELCQHLCNKMHSTQSLAQCGSRLMARLILPERGPRRLIIVEAKRCLSGDAKIKVVGQLLMYYGGALELGTRGLRLLRRFAVKHPRATRSRRPKSLKSLTAGVSPPELAWAELRKGRILRPNQIVLVAALDDRPGPKMKQALSTLLEHHALNIAVVSVLGPNQLVVWRPH